MERFANFFLINQSSVPRKAHPPLKRSVSGSFLIEGEPFQKHLFHLLIKINEGLFSSVSKT